MDPKKKKKNLSGDKVTLTGTWYKTNELVRLCGGTLKLVLYQDMKRTI